RVCGGLSVRAIRSGTAAACCSRDRGVQLRPGPILHGARTSFLLGNPAPEDVEARAGRQSGKPPEVLRKHYCRHQTEGRQECCFPDERAEFVERSDDGGGRSYSG